MEIKINNNINNHNNKKDNNFNKNNDNVMDDFYKIAIQDLKQQIAVLADQRATQVSLNAMKQAEIQSLRNQLKEVMEKNKELEDELTKIKANNAGPVPKKDKGENK